ncbi:MAG TPA: hypothetical protein VN729_12015 [Ktedonobacteraceae bacterium]|nr:hypothetical protein [Ktedonobacteraceae bacterium]
MLNEELHNRLMEYGVTASDETTLRETLEMYIETYTLFKLAPWPARRWKCYYRLMMRDQMYDGQSVEEVYALALLDRLT